MWFLFAAVALGAGISENSLHSYFNAVGSACIGYSSIRILPADFFSRAMSLSRYMTAPAEARSIDAILQYLGLGLLLAGVVVRYAG
jgi:hypothetical protein